MNRLDEVDSVNIYRFKFTNDVMTELYNFSKIHQYDARCDFKEAWTVWMENNEELILNETERLYKLGYDGDVVDKMYKSARYYFRKKSTVKKDPVKRRQYISVPKELLDCMDTHISSHIHEQPKNGFIDFCQRHEDIIKPILTEMLQKGFNDSHLIQDKIKKTYKNRYFTITSKI